MIIYWAEILLGYLRRIRVNNYIRAKITLLKILLPLAFCLSAAFSSFSQSSHVIYLKSDGSKTTNADSADSYIMYERAANDSLWLLQQFGMNHMIMTSGYYADEAMSIPHGKFTYYQYFNGGKRVKYDFERHRYDTISIDAVNYISKTGYFVNGKRNGRWQLYDEYGTLHEVCFYQDDRLSGFDRYYTDDGKHILEEGFLKDGLRDGVWNFFSPKGTLLGTIRYYKGQRQGLRSKLNSKTLSVKNGMPDYDLTAYLAGALRNRKLTSFRDCSLTYSFHLNKEGKLTQPETMQSGCNIELDVAIGEILMDAPVWNAAIKDRQTVEATAVIFLKVRFDADKKPHVSFYHTSDADDNIILLSTEY